MHFASILFKWYVSKMGCQHNVPFREMDISVKWLVSESEFDEMFLVRWDSVKWHQKNGCLQNGHWQNNL